MILTNFVVINSCFGGFGLSEEALRRLRGHDEYTIPRNSLALVRVVRALGKAANGDSACLEIVKLPPGKYVISDYDGQESICEYHRVMGTDGKWYEADLVVTVPR